MLVSFDPLLPPLDDLQHVQTHQNTERQKTHQENHYGRVLRSFCLDNFASGRTGSMSKNDKRVLQVQLARSSQLQQWTC